MQQSFLRKPDHLYEGTHSDNSKDVWADENNHVRFLMQIKREREVSLTDKILDLAKQGQSDETISLTLSIAKESVRRIRLENGLRRTAGTGTASAARKLSDEDVRAIRSLVAAGCFQKEIAARYGIGEAMVSRIKHYYRRQTT